jgi:H+/Na+-translocating ferredoxin:NAD+ oxidoreductase subunit G
MTAPAVPPTRPSASAQRLIATLGGFGALAGLLIVSVYAATQPTIRANKAAALAAAINEVLAAPDRYDTLYVTADSLSRQLPAGANAETAEAVYLGWRGETPAGFAIVANGPGFQDNIRLIFGFDAVSSQLLGMKVLESKETPGLGDKIYKDAEFGAQFSQVHAPIVGVKKGQGNGRPTELVMITGATISSRAVIKAINTTLEHVGPLLAAYEVQEPPS